MAVPAAGAMADNHGCATQRGHGALLDNNRLATEIGYGTMLDGKVGPWSEDLTIKSSWLVVRGDRCVLQGSRKLDKHDSLPVLESPAIDQISLRYLPESKISPPNRNEYHFSALD